MFLVIHWVGSFLCLLCNDNGPFTFFQHLTFLTDNVFNLPVWSIPENLNNDRFTRAKLH